MGGKKKLLGPYMLSYTESDPGLGLKWGTILAQWQKKNISEVLQYNIP